MNYLWITIIWAIFYSPRLGRSQGSALHSTNISYISQHREPSPLFGVLQAHLPAKYLRYAKKIIPEILNVFLRLCNAFESHLAILCFFKKFRNTTRKVTKHQHPETFKKRYSYKTADFFVAFRLYAFYIYFLLYCSRS